MDWSISIYRVFCLPLFLFQALCFRADFLYAGWLCTMDELVLGPTEPKQREGKQLWECPTHQHHRNLLDKGNIPSGEQVFIAQQRESAFTLELHQNLEKRSSRGRGHQASPGAAICCNSDLWVDADPLQPIGHTFAATSHTSFPSWDCPGVAILDTCRCIWSFQRVWITGPNWLNLDSMGTDIHILAVSTNFSEANKSLHVPLHGYRTPVCSVLIGGCNPLPKWPRGVWIPACRWNPSSWKILATFPLHNTPDWHAKILLLQTKW